MDTNKTPLTFEESLIRLEEIVGQLDDGRTDIETALARYEEGVGLLQRCHGILENTRRKIEILRGRDENGTPQVEQVDEDMFRTRVT